MKNFIVQLLVILLPWSIRRFILVKICRYNISKSARIGLSIINSKKVILAEHSRIGHLNIISRLESLEIGEYSIISNLNYIYGFPKGLKFFDNELDRVSSLIIKNHAAISSRHIIDCTDKVVLGSFSTIAGYRSTILTHSIDFKTGKQTSGSVNIGEYSFIGTNCVLLKNANIPNRSLIAAGSVITEKLFDVGCIIGGVPGKVIGQIPDDWEYFNRTVGVVH